MSDDTGPIVIRLATPADAEALIVFDHLASAPDSARRTFIRRTIDASACYVAVTGGRPVGYATLEYTFYDNGMITMLYVAPAFRRRGVGTALVGHIESVCATPKLFTSTNRSNTRMQNLLHRLGFQPSGIIENLDEGDPELVYFKRLKAD